MLVRALIAETFLENTASQLTYYGLSELASNVREQELSILFRNNHFITLYKNQGQLYQLVTDQGFLQEPDVVWMTLSHIDNDDIFVNHEFKPISPKSNTLSPNEQKKQIDQDYLIALSIEEEEKKALANQAGMELEYDELITINDEELARKLQEEEDRKEKLEAIKNRAINKYNNDGNRYYNDDRDFSPEDRESLGYRSIDYRRQQQVNQQFDDFRTTSNHRQHQQQQEQELQNSQLDFQQSEFEHENTLRNESLRHNKRSNSSENYTQSSSSRDRNSNHHHSQNHNKRSNSTENHGHHSKSSKCIIS